MRVAHVIPTLALRTGGPPVAVVESCRALNAVGVETAIFTTDLREAASAPSHDRSSPHRWPEGAEALDVRLFEARPPYRLAFSPALNSALARDARAFDVVHIHSLFLFPQFAAYRAAARTGVPYVVAPRGAFDPHLAHRGRLVKRLAEMAWQRRMLEGAAALHLTSEQERAHAASVAPAVPRIVIPNGVRMDGFGDTGSGAEARRLYGLGDAPVVAFVGRLSHKKGLDVLLRAFATVTESFPSARLLIAGPDDEGMTPLLLATARDAGIAERVTFAGMLPQARVREVLAAADVWALPSSGENFGNAFAEALAAGRACVVSPDVALAAEAGQAGAALVAPREPAPFARAIAGLIADESCRSTLGARARDFVRRYDWQRVAPGLARMYESVLRQEVRLAA